MAQRPDHSVTVLELFFDLVFVYAITQIAALIRNEHSIRGYALGALVFLIVWWSWSQFTWTGNAIDLNERVPQIGVLVATGTAFFMARGVGNAYGDAAWWFTVPYGLTMAIGLGLYWWGLRHDRGHQQALRAYFPIVIPGVLIVVAAGFIDEGARTWIYVLAVLVLGASGVSAERSRAFRIAPSHFAERHSLIVIIALGESLIAVGVASSGLERTIESVSAVTVGVIGALALWWAYFDWFSDKTEQRFRDTASDEQAMFARDAYTFGHYPLVFGVVAFAIAVEEAIAHPQEALEATGRFGLGVGLALFLATTAAIHLRASGNLLVERLIAAVAMAAVAALAADLTAIRALSAVVGLLVVALTIEWKRHKGAPVRAARVGRP